MGTPSSITAKIDGKFHTIYCHWDGYPSFNGKILFEEFTTQEKVESLIALGGLSSLGASVECPEGHSYKSPVKGHCIAYGRDRGETGEEAKVSETWLEAMNSMSEEYNYSFRDGVWYVGEEVLTEDIIKND